MFSILNKLKSVMFGHAIADSLGVPVEFCSRSWLNERPVHAMMGYGSHSVPAGCWSDDTSMALCALQSLSNGKIDYNEIMQNFGKWLYYGDFTATGIAFDVGGTCYEAISKYNLHHWPVEHCGCNGEMDNGNGSLMRIHPFVLYAYMNGIKDDNEFVNMIAKASSLTHAHQCTIDGCVIYAYILMELLHNPSKQSVYVGLAKAKDKIKTSATYYNRLYSTDLFYLNRNDIKSSGYVVDSLEAALWCLLTTDSYKDCVLAAVNLGGDTDTVAAIAGGLAGALYGIDSIPKDWMDTLIKADYIDDMCDKAYERWMRI